MLMRVLCASKYKGLFRRGGRSRKLEKRAMKVIKVLQDKHGRRAWRTELLEGERRVWDIRGRKCRSSSPSVSCCLLQMQLEYHCLKFFYF